ncbi:MAG: peptidyl-prolyl cis-trans isomerase C [Candidatus Latescibacterota bacterium]|jgi:peptidyl-prolyl cis-trans isomerase C
MSITPTFIASLLLGFSVLLGNLTGCGSEPETPPNPSDPTLATVDGTPIPLSEFLAFSKPIPEGMKKGETPLAKERQVLESLVDKRLLLTEANSLPLDEETSFQDELAVFNQNRLLELYAKREVTDKVVVSDEEMEQHFRETHRDRALRFNGIMLESLAEAKKILAEIEAGGDFMQLAKGHSLHRESGEQGGDIGGYKLKDKVHPSIAESIFALKIGEVTQPIPLHFEGKPSFAVFQVTDEMPAPMAASERKIREEIFGRKRAERYKVLLDSLTHAYDPQIQTEQVSWLIQYSSQPNNDLSTPPADWATKAICTYRDGQISLDYFFQISRQVRAGQTELADSSRVLLLLNQVIIPSQLFGNEARTFGLDQHPGLLKRVQAKREDLLINALRQLYVDENIDASEEEARAFYDANPIKFTSPVTSEIVEILVASDTLAQRIKDQIVAGADPVPLASQYTTREGADHHDGHLSVSTYTKAHYKDIFDIVQETEIGQIVGPLRTAEGYSVFKVLDRKREKAPYNADSKRRSIAYIKIGKSRNGYVSFVRGLREKYPVKFFEDAIVRTLTPAK